ncbi:MAG: hypothetical protein AB4060_10520 [Crocosphaera sp.]
MKGDPSKFGQTIGLFLSTILITVTYDFFKQQLSLEKNFWTIIFIFIFFLVVIKLTEILIIIIIEKSVRIKKILLREEYLDGLWVDEVSLENSQEGFPDNSFAYIWIKQEKGYCKIIGKEYDKNCNLICNWYSTAVQFNDLKFQYLYRADLKKPPKQITGFTNLTLYPLGQIPLKYEGIFIDILEDDPKNPKTRIGHISGQKIPEKDANRIGDNPKEIQRWIQEKKNKNSRQ